MHTISAHLSFKIVAIIRPKGGEDRPPEHSFATIDEEPDDVEGDGACDDEFHYYALGLS